MVNHIQCTTHIQGSPLQYEVKWSERARRLRLSVTNDGVLVTLPRGTAAAEAERFIQQNSAWLGEQLRKLEHRQAKARSQSLPGDVILLRGKPTQVRVIEEEGRRVQALVRETGSRLEVLLPEGAGSKKGKVLENAMREMARDELTRAVTTHARAMRVSPKGINIRDQRTRWGSCSTRGTLSFNWRLVMAPPEVLNYVVVHELAHLRVPNHSREFWNLVSQYFPAYKEARLWLKRNAARLHPNLN